jgi:hypothetical protein
MLASLTMQSATTIVVTSRRHDVTAIGVPGTVTNRFRACWVNKRHSARYLDRADVLTRFGSDVFSTERRLMLHMRGVRCRFHARHGRREFARRSSNHAQRSRMRATGREWGIPRS